jgi:hypothetical protein
LDDRTKAQQELAEIKSKFISSIPPLNRKKMEDLLQMIIDDLKPLEAQTIERMYTSISNKVDELIKKGDKLDAKKLDFRIFPSWKNLVNFERSEDEIEEEFRGRTYKKKVSVFRITSKRSNYEESLRNDLKWYVEGLKGKLLKAMGKDFDKITMPIEKVEQVKIELSEQGFEGSYRFIFKNGSSFVYNTSSIGAGGYAIQIFHYRYITSFSDVKLADGTKGKNSKYEILKHFTDK